MAGTDSTQISLRQGPCVILDHPQLAENIGMTARAMMNCGMVDLRLVNPMQDHLSSKATAPATHGLEVLQKARIFESIPEAAADLNLVFATTARVRETTKEVITAEEAGIRSEQVLREGQRVGFLFGREKSGLTNEDASYADVLVTIPLNPAYASLNLAQSVLLMGYEWFKNSQAYRPLSNVGEPQILVQKDQLYAFFDQMTRCLDESGYFVVPEKRDLMLEKMRNLYHRANLTHNEVMMLMGMMKQISKGRIKSQNSLKLEAEKGG